MPPCLGAGGPQGGGRVAGSPGSRPLVPVGAGCGGGRRGEGVKHGRNRWGCAAQVSFVQDWGGSG